MDHTSLDPSRLKPNLVRDGNLKPGLTTPSYTGGVPSDASQVKPSLLDASGQLKPGLVSGADLKPSQLLGESTVEPPPPTNVLTLGGDPLTLGGSQLTLGL